MNYFDTVIKKVVGSNPGFAAKKEAARPNLNRPRQGHRILLLYHICPALSFSKIHSPSLSLTHILYLSLIETHTGRISQHHSAFIVFWHSMECDKQSSFGRSVGDGILYYLTIYLGTHRNGLLSFYLSHTNKYNCISAPDKSQLFSIWMTPKKERRERNGLHKLIG